MTIAKAIARAWTDPDYKAKLLNDPHAALADVGVAIPTGTTIKFIENTADTRHIALPISPTETGEVSMEELEKIASDCNLICWTSC